MRPSIPLSLVFLAATLSCTTQAATLNKREYCTAGSCLDLAVLTAAAEVQVPSVLSQKDLTNAQRLARGLPLNPPARRASGALSARRPQVSPVSQVAYVGFIQVFAGTTLMGYISPDPSQYTPVVNYDRNAALLVSFQLAAGATSGSQISIIQKDARGPFFAPVVGADGTGSDIGPGSFDYLYLDPVSAPTAPGATPQSVPSYYSTVSGLNQQTETSVWSVDLTSGAVTAQWINTDGSMPATILFIQGSNVYAGGDPGAFQAQYPKPVTVVTFQFVPM